MLVAPNFVGKYQNCLFDWESNGLLDTVTECWCMTAYDLDTDKLYTFSRLTSKTWEKDAIDLLENAKLHSSHNGYGFDYPLMKMMYDVKYSIRPDVFNSNTELEIYDTYILSQMADPERDFPNVTMINKTTGEKKRVGKHSVESYGHQFGLLKKEINYWDQFSLKIIERCEYDTKIQAMIHRYLMNRLHKQAGYL